MEEGCENWDPLVIHDFFVDVLEVVQQWRKTANMV